MLTYAETIRMGSPTKTLHVGFPTLHRYDLLDRSLDTIFNGTRLPDSVLVVDNGGDYVAKHPNVTVLRHGYNLGVAASLNFIQDYYGDEDVVIMNDDAAVGRRTLEWFTKVQGWFVTALSYGCFLRRKANRKLIGRFDEFYWPMYWEDCDLDLRLIRAISDPYGETAEVPSGVLKNYGGILELNHLPEAECHHMEGGSRSKRGWMDPWLGRTMSRFQRKWGAMNRQVAPNLIPFNGEPDCPFQTYLDECLGNPGYAPYMKHLFELCADCDSVVETLADVGRWTMCFLQAKVKNIWTYAWQHNPEWDYLPRMATLRPTTLKLVSGYNPFDAIPETDVLFLHEDHNFVTNLSFSRQHPRVRKHIVFLGEHDLTCPARDKFREEHPSGWEQSFHLNGLTVFSRKQ